MQDHTQALREALQGFLDFHTKPAGISVELITEKDLFTQALADIGKREDALIAAARAALSSNQSAPVALGGEKGEAVAWRFRWHPEGDWHLTEKEPRGGDGTTKQPLFAAPVGKARMLTDEEADHITGMHNTGRSQGDSECAEAIQRKFCEVNGITLEAK